MKICIVCGGFPPDKYGGVENSLAAFREAMEKRGHEITVIAQDFRGKKGQGKNMHWFDVEPRNPFPQIGMVGFFTDALQFARWYFEVWKFLRRREFDIYHGHQIWGFVGCLAKKGKWVLTPRNVIVPSASWLKSLSHKAHYFILRRALDKADRVVAISGVLEENIAQHSQANRAKIRRIYNGIDLRKFRRLKLRRERDGKKRLLFAGKLKPEKGVLDVLRAYRLLRERGIDAELVVAGTGAHLERLKKEYPEVSFLGFVGQERLIEEYNKADAYVVYAPKTTADESFCNSLAEAMACECAVVCSDIPIYREITKGKAFFAESESPERLADAIEGAIKRKDLAEIGKEMRKVAENYSLERCVEAHEAMYRELLAEGRLKPEDYGENYFLNETRGSAEFRESRGEMLGEKHGRVLSLLEPKSGERILDIGCGRGELAYHAAKSGATCFGLDFSPAALRLAQEKNRGRLVQGACTELPFRKGAFDAAVLGDIIEHIDREDAVRCIAAAHLALKKGGRLLIHTNNVRTVKAAEILGIIQGTRFRRNDPKKTRHINFLGRLELERMLSDAGFRSMAWTEKIGRKRFNFPARDAMLDAACRLGFGADLFALGVKK
ncbi:MAG: glycosyltransferase [Candidatus Diapherotrites archaeon]